LQSNDKIIWRDFKIGDEIAFTHIFQSHYQALYAYGHCFTSESEWIKDCIQEVFSELWQNRKKVAQVSKIRPYLMVYLKRKIFSSENNITISLPSESAGVEIPYENFLIDQETTTTMKTLLSSCIEHLTQRQKEVIYLKFYAGMDYKDISDITSIKYQSVRNLVHEAIKTLKKDMRHFIQ
jgi:RNA polymerase sigma factor (sigma-70 family)